MKVRPMDHPSSYKVVFFAYCLKNKFEKFSFSLSLLPEYGAYTEKTFIIVSPTTSHLSWVWSWSVTLLHLWS